MDELVSEDFWDSFDADQQRIARRWSTGLLWYPDVAPGSQGDIARQVSGYCTKLRHTVTHWSRVLKTHPSMVKRWQRGLAWPSQAQAYAIAAELMRTGGPVVLEADCDGSAVEFTFPGGGE